MTVSIFCPNCAQSIEPEDTTCPNCGIDLAMAVLLAEHAVEAKARLPYGAPMTPEILVPRLGDYLIEKGVLSTENLQQALDYQKAHATNGHAMLLGQTLLELGLIDREILDQVVTEQILQLQAALQQSNRRLEQRVQERTVDLQNALNKLTELNQLKSSFISSISHELRTPLTHLKGYLDLLAEGGLGPLTSEQNEAIDVLLRAESRLEALIDDLIRFSLAARGELTLIMSPIGVNELINSAINRASKMAKARMISLVEDLPSDLPLIRGDVDKISWVIFQLLDNAIKFTPQGGKVSISSVSDGKLVTFRVIDTGIGIPDNRIEQIFEPFFQLDGADTRRYGGTGLGLALVKRILEAHGSPVKVRSHLGQGSCFEFFLPAINN